MKMYKLFVTPVTKRILPHGFLFTSKQQGIVQRSMRLCSFCNFYHRKMLKFVKHDQFCTSSTTANILDHSPIKKKVKKRTKKYTELLTVTNEKASNKGTKVQTLPVSDVSMFVEQSDINNAYDIKGPIINENFDSQNIMEDYHVFCDNGINLNISFNFINLFFIILPQKEMELHKIWNKYTEQNYTENLLACMQVYLRCGLLTRADHTLMKYRKSFQNKQAYCDQHIELYNVLLEAYAFKRKIGKVLELYDLIKKDSLTPTPQTYTYIFDALGRETTNNNRIALLEKLNSEMNSYNISFSDIFNKSCLKNDQRKNVLKLIKILMPHFEPSYTQKCTKYKCQLLSTIPLKNNYESPVKGLLTIEELKKLFEVQFENECTIEVQIPSIEADEKNLNTTSTSVRYLESYWKKAALAAFERNLKCLKQKECQFHNNLMVLHPFLEVLDKEYYINAILREIRQIARGLENYSSSLKGLYINLGKYIHRKYEVRNKIETNKCTGVLDNIVSVYLKYLDWYQHPENVTHLSNTNNRTIWQYYEHEKVKNGAPLHTIPLRWPMDTIINVGKFLYNIILNDIILQSDILKGQDLKCSIPAFYTLFRNSGTYLSEQIKPHPFVSKLYKESHIKSITFDSLELPSHSPPRPWVSIYSGGYLITKTDFIRIPDHTNGSWRKLQKASSVQLFPVIDSLNQLSSIPWRINTVILDIVIKIFKSGGSIELNVPQSISVLSQPSPISKNATAEEKQKAAIAWARYKQQKFDMYSLWCDALYKLSIANHFRNKIFWLPHNLDFRGRVYPVPPHLNHLSSDLGRSLLLFAKGKPLGPNGLDWLKLHVINLTNFKKGSSIKERLKYANENMENILDSAAKPLTGKMWWAQSEEPWQTLAACIEIANALKTPKVEEYVSTFPVHQDGSCNGLQHYAALGRDQIGAESVNLYSFDSPQDVYVTVASVVEKQRQIDAKNNIKIAQVLKGFVKRKVIKQTVMTTVYGVTKYGAKLQIAKQLEDTVNFPMEHVWSASIYLADRTFYSLRTMFKSAREIQDWLTACARIISSIFYENVEWITPLGLPIVQPYTKQKFHKNFIKNTEKPDTMKQRNAFPPNFIHSLDSTHMMLTSLHCNKENVTFVSVHDCFWTHPCTVDTMNRICREQFVALHSEPILENLADFFVNRYVQIYEKQPSKLIDVKEVQEFLTSVPSKGTFDINNVLSSTYFFN
ncbi:PREDICTED: DNA-directed RNA polymerase, mitochondrial [Habropoda laboriosa]|uniref:DNA-directed RNA polymerase, mitochondrial n=1 Tax=Habropoda laboriosa TaxID=597456 RepID=UPI00083CF287|nr:PREDICTED: DNA-directed RNA polymerase, mitochondrial [Habropoda laboriosa]